MSEEPKQNPTEGQEPETKEKSKKDEDAYKDVPKFEVPEKYKRFLPQINKFLADHIDQLAGVAAMARKYRSEQSLKFVPSNGFAFYLETGHVGVDAKFWEWKEKWPEFNDNMMVFASVHEIGHFFDLAEDPEGFAAGFEHMKEFSKQTIPEIKEIWTEKSAGKLPDYITDKFIEEFLYGRIHKLYNSFDDIYVNKRGAQACHDFSKGGQAEQDKYILYRDYLFPTSKQGEKPYPGEVADYSDMNLDRQLGAYLLRKSMIPDQEVKVAPEVKNALDKVMYNHPTMGSITTEKLVQEVITASPVSMSTTPNTASNRYPIIESMVEPLWKELLLEDVKRRDVPKKPFKGKEKPGQGSGETDDDVNDEPTFDDQDVKDFNNQQKRKNRKDKKAQKAKEKESQKTPEKVASDKELERLERMAKENGISPEAARDYWKTKNKIKSEIENLVNVFEKLLQNITAGIIEYYETGFKTGILDEERLVDKYAEYFVEGAKELIDWEDLDPYKQVEFMQEVKILPSDIRIRFISDASGSIHDGRRIKKIKEIAVLLLESLKVFQDDVRREIFGDFMIDTQIIIFGSSVEIAKPFLGKDKVADYYANEVAKLRAFENLNKELGGTNDSLAWNLVNGSLSDSDHIERLHSGESKEIIFEVTDGESEQAEQTAFHVEQVKEKGAVVIGLQIAHEKRTDGFKNAFGKDGRAVEDYTKIVEVIAEILAKNFQDIKFEQNFDD